MSEKELTELIEKIKLRRLELGLSGWEGMKDAVAKALAAKA